MWIPRTISPTVRRCAAQFPVVVLTGARQAGKTSLVRRLFPRADYVSFDVPRHAEAARLDGAGFLADRGSPLLIDEVQYAPEIFRHIKVSVDADRTPGRFILTGSQDLALMQGVSESLAGRCAVLSLPTLSLSEIRALAKGRADDELCWRSGYPELWQRPEIDRELWLGSYLATYLERDVRNALHVGNLRDFDRFLRAAAARTGQLLSLAELGRDVGVATNTAKSWLSVLQANRQVVLLEPYFRNVGKRLIKTPKLYFLETGLLIHLMGFTDWPAVVKNAAWGAIWENLVVSEVYKHFWNRGQRPPVWFWQTAQGHEIDMLIGAGPDRFLAIECKTAAEVEPRVVSRFDALARLFGPDSLAAAAVVCRTEEAYPLAPRGLIKAIPLTGRTGLAAWLERSRRRPA